MVLTLLSLESVFLLFVFLHKYKVILLFAVTDFSSFITTFGANIP